MAELRDGDSLLQVLAPHKEEESLIPSTHTERAAHNRPQLQLWG